MGENDMTQQSQPPRPRETIQVSAKPETLDLPLSSTALLVVDMQNSYGSPGGFRALAGRKMDGMQPVIANNVRVINAARAAGLPIVFLQTGWDPELKNAGGPHSPNYYKSNPLKLMRERPEMRGKILVQGSWDFELIPGIVPAPEDTIILKPRYSGFKGTNLDAALRERNVRHLIVIGLTANVCVESTIRDAYHEEYFCLMIEDATEHSGPPFTRDAVLFNVQTFFGWTTSTDVICEALAPAASAAGAAQNARQATG
jgi:ureidoacrylate peracid hydrolase